MSEYVVDYTDPGKFEEYWQPEYAFGAFFIFPPDDVLEMVDALRGKYDPKSANYCRAHISLSEPLGQPLTQGMLDEIEEMARQVEPFEMSYGPLITFPPHPGVCFRVEPKDRFFNLRARLHDRTAFEGRELGRKDIAPHMTIAEFGLNFIQSEKLKNSLQGTVPEGRFYCDAIEYAVPNDRFYFERKLRIPLGTSH